MQIREITVASMIDTNQSVTIPHEWVQQLSATDKFAILLKNNPSMFRIVTTKNPIATEFYLDLEILEEDFLETMFKRIESVKLKPIYSSGVCFVEDTCYYLFIVDGDPKPEVKDKLVSILKEIQGVKEITIRTHSMD